MVQPITDQRAFLMEAKKALEELSDLKERNEQLRLDMKKKEKELEAERKAVTDAISLTIKSVWMRSVPAMIRRSARGRNG